MRKTTTTLVVLLTALVAVGCSKDSPGPKATAPPAVVNCAAAEVPSNTPPTPNTIDSTCAVIPKDMNGTGDTQGGPDLYSWLTFVAVNWPPEKRKTAAPEGAVPSIRAPSAPAVTRSTRASGGRRAGEKRDGEFSRSSSATVRTARMAGAEHARRTAKTARRGETGRPSLRRTRDRISARPSSRAQRVEQ